MGRQSAYYRFNEDTSTLYSEQYVYYNNQLSKVKVQDDPAAKYYVGEMYYYDKLLRLIKKDRYNINKQVKYSYEYEYKGNSVSEYLINKNIRELQNTKEYSGNILIKEKVYESDQVVDADHAKLFIHGEGYEKEYFYSGERLQKILISQKDKELYSLKFHYFNK